MRRSLVLLLPALVLSAVGCETVDSTDIDTGGVEATIVVVADGDAVDVRANLSVGGLTSLSLEGGDRLVASAAGESVDLDESGFLGTTDFTGRLAVAPEPGTVVTVALLRGGDATDAPRSTVALPAPITVRHPPAGSGFDRRQDLVITVDATGGDYRVGWRGSCVVESTAADAGVRVAGDTIVVPAGTVLPRKGRGSRRCAVTFDLVRVVQGDLDGAYDEGRITAERTTSLTLGSGRRPAKPGVAPADDPVADPPATAPGSTAPTRPADGDDDRLWLVGGVLIGALAVAGGAFALGRRTRR